MKATGRATSVQNDRVARQHQQLRCRADRISRKTHGAPDQKVPTAAKPKNAIGSAESAASAFE